MVSDLCLWSSSLALAQYQHQDLEVSYHDLRKQTLLLNIIRFFQDVQQLVQVLLLEFVARMSLQFAFFQPFLLKLISFKMGLAYFLSLLKEIFLFNYLFPKYLVCWYHSLQTHLLIKMDCVRLLLVVKLIRISIITLVEPELGLQPLELLSESVFVALIVQKMVKVKYTPLLLHWTHLHFLFQVALRFMSSLLQLVLST